MWSTMPPHYGSGRYTADNNGTVVKTRSNTLDVGRWVRQYDGYLNVLYFGAFGKTQDYTIPIQNAINFAWLNAQNDPDMKGSVVYIPNGNYRINTLKIKSGISIIGENIDRTYLQITENHTADYMMETEIGPTFIHMENLSLHGRDQTNSGGILLKEGVWNSTFKNIKIFRFGGHGINMDTVANSPLPNQFNVFENVRIEKTTDFNHCLKISGQTGQTTFINCNFDGFKKFNNNIPRFPKGHNVNITNAGDRYPAILSFINCSFQEADYAIYMTSVENINIDTCWFENVGVGITALSCKDITVQNSRFANASGYGSLVVSADNIKAGQCLSVANSTVNVYNNYVSATEPNSPNVSTASSFIFAEDNRYGGVAISDNVFQDTKLAFTHGIVQGVVATSNTLDCAKHKFVFANGIGIPVKVIKSSINASETLKVRSSGGVGGTFIFSSGGNIYLMGKSSLNLKAGETAVFMMVDSELGAYKEHWQLISVTRANDVF